MSIEKKWILFVDDQENVLNGLRRLLRPMRSQWHMTFVSSGREALQALEEDTYDIIISDMRMPEMAGDELLTEVRKKYPSIVRLALSGQADKDQILQSVGPIHQFLQKPCDKEILKSAILSSLEMGKMLSSRSLRSIVTEIESLPSLPSHQKELMAQFQMPDISSRKIGESIGQDMAMTAKILQLVNSSFFGLHRQIGTAEEATALLGLDTVRSLVMTVQVFSQISPGEVEGFSQEFLFMHGLKVAAIAKKIMLSAGMSEEEAEYAYLAGLLHNVGMLVLASKRPSEYADSIALAKSSELSEEDAERQIIGASHGEIGAYLLTVWAFDTPIVEAALYHHRPGDCISDQFTTLTAVHIADAIARSEPSESDGSDIFVDYEYLKKVGVDHRIPEWINANKAVA